MRVYLQNFLYKWHIWDIFLRNLSKNIILSFKCFTQPQLSISFSSPLIIQHSKTYSTFMYTKQMKMFSSILKQLINILKIIIFMMVKVIHTIRLCEHKCSFSKWEFWLVWISRSFQINEYWMCEFLELKQTCNHPQMNKYKEIQSHF